MQLMLSPSGGLILPESKPVLSNSTSSSEIQPLGDPYIDQLPAEVLLRIFELINGNVKFRPELMPRYGHADLKPVKILPLMLVCRKWNVLMGSILYRGLFLTFQTAKGLRTWQKLQQTLLAHNDLCHYVQQIHLVFSSSLNRSNRSSGKVYLDGESQSAAANQLVESFRPRTIELSGDWEEDIDSRLCASLMRFEIEDLTVHGAWIEFVFRYLELGNCGRLKQLKLNFSRHYGMLNATSKWSHGRFAGVDIPAEQCRSISLEKLEVYGGDVSAIEVGVICRYAKALRILKLHYLMHAAYAWTFDRIGIQRLLDMHHDSLEVISVPIFFNTDGISLDFSACLKLKALTISDYNLFLDTPEQAAHKLSQIHSLTVDTDAGDQQINGIGNFDGRSAQWIEKFSILSSVRKVHVIFDWFEDRMKGRYGGEVPDQEWPDTHLKALHTRLAEFDVELTWSGGTMTEQEWNAELVRLREENLHRNTDDEETMQQDFGDHSSDSNDWMQSASELESEAEAEMYRIPQEKPGPGAKQRRIDHMLTRKQLHQAEAANGIHE